MNFAPKSAAFALSVLFLASSSEAALPRHWTDATAPAPVKRADQIRSLRAWNDSRADRSEVARDFDSYLSATESLAQSDALGAGRRPKRPWYLQSLKAEIGVEAEGEIGFLGMGGEAAVELIWTRSPAVVARLIERAREKGKVAPRSLALHEPLLQSTEAAEIEAGEQADADASLDTTMSDAEIAGEVDAIVSGLEMHPRQKGEGVRIRDFARVRRELLAQIARVRPALLALASAPADWNWQPYKFQLELFVLAEGNVYTAVTVGAVTRIRLEWNIVRRPAAPIPTVGLAGITQLVREMDRVAAFTGDQRAFGLAAFKAGIGFGSEVELGVAEFKGHALGSVFFKRTRKDALTVAAPKALLFVSGDGNALEIPASRFAAGIHRAAEIVDGITARAERHEARAASRGKERQFQLGAVEIELELTPEGGLVLPTVSKFAAVELFFVRGGILGSGGAN